MLIQGLSKLQIVSPFGERVRNGVGEFHPGIDIRVWDKPNNNYTILSVLAPEKMIITRVELDPKWGHFIVSKPVEENELGIIEFRFWHQVPDVDCIVDTLFDKDVIISFPEANYISQHLHFETRIDYRGTTCIDPIEYLKIMGQEFEIV